MKFAILIAFLVTFALAASAAGFLLDWKNRAALFQPVGHITQGTREGVSVGDSLTSATGALRSRGYDDTPSWGRDLCGDFTPKGDQTIHHFWKPDAAGVRIGGLCIVSSSNRVDAIGWSFEIGMP